MPELKRQSIEVENPITEIVKRLSGTPGKCVLNGRNIVNHEKPFKALAETLAESKFDLTHTISEQQTRYQRYSFDFKNRSWSVMRINKFNGSGSIDTYVQLPLNRLIIAMRGGNSSPGCPDGSVLSPIAAAGIKIAAKLLRPPATLVTSDTLERNRETVRLYIEEFKNKQNFGIFPKLFAPGFTHHFDHEGLDGDMHSWAMTGQDFLRAFPDVRVNIHDLIVEGDYVVEHNTAFGTHKGRFRGLRATGREVSWNEMHLYRLDSGKIVENWPSVPFEDIYQKINQTDC